MEHKSYQTIPGVRPSGCICLKSRAKLPGRAKTVRCQPRRNASLGIDMPLLQDAYARPQFAFKVDPLN